VRAYRRHRAWPVWHAAVLPLMPLDEMPTFAELAGEKPLRRTMPAEQVQANVLKFKAALAAGNG